MHTKKYITEGTKKLFYVNFILKAIIALFSVAFLATEITFYGKSIVEFVCIHISPLLFVIYNLHYLSSRQMCIYEVYISLYLHPNQTSDLHIDRIVNKNALRVYQILSDVQELDYLYFNYMLQSIAKKEQNLGD